MAIVGRVIVQVDAAIRGSSGGVLNADQLFWIIDSALVETDWFGSLVES